MNKIATLALAAALAATTLSAHAQITLDGVITAAEIGTGGNKYQSLGAFSTPHVSTAGFGNAGLLRMYGANTNSKLYIALAGFIDPNPNPAGLYNNFQLYLDLPNKSGVPIGTPLPSIAGTATVFGTFGTNSIGGTKLEMEGDVAIATTGKGDVQAVVYKSATNAVAASLDGGVNLLTDGTPKTLVGTTGDYALLANTRASYKASTGDITTNPGGASGEAGSTGLEYEFDRAALGLPSGASIVKVMAAYVSGDAYWSSDVIPEIPGNGNNNLGFSPDFTALTGTQAASINVVVLSSRQADDAAVAMSVFPNPSEGSSTISYQVKDAAQSVLVRVTDLLGRSVRTLLDAKQSSGLHDLNVATGDLSRGTYLVQVQVGDKVATRRLAVTR